MTHLLGVSLLIERPVYQCVSSSRFQSFDGGAANFFCNSISDYILKRMPVVTPEHHYVCIQYVNAVSDVSMCRSVSVP